MAPPSPPEWVKKAKRFLGKRAKRAKDAIKSLGRQESWSFGSGFLDDDGRGGGAGDGGNSFDAHLAGYRRLKSQRSGKWDPDILAAWGGNPVLFTNEDLQGSDMRVETIRDANHGRGRSFGVLPDEDDVPREREPLWPRKEAHYCDGVVISDGEEVEDDAFYSALGNSQWDWSEIPAIRLRLIYFLICFAMSISSPFFVLYMKNEIGLSAGQVGTVAALQIVGGYAVGPAVSLVVDRFQIHKPLWVASIILGIIPVGKSQAAHGTPPFNFDPKTRANFILF